MSAYNPLELSTCWLLMYTSILEKIEFKVLFTWVTRGTGTTSSTAYSYNPTSLQSSFSPFWTNRPLKISVSSPRKFVSEKRKTFVPLEIQTLSTFGRVRQSQTTIVRGTPDIVNCRKICSMNSRNCHKSW